MWKDTILGESESIAKLFLTLANQKRVQIICKLLDGETSVGDLANTVQLSQSAISQHLSKLRANDIVKTRRDGQIIYYSMRDLGVEKLLECYLKIYHPGKA